MHAVSPCSYNLFYQFIDCILYAEIIISCITILRKISITQYCHWEPLAAAADCVQCWHIHQKLHADAQADGYIPDPLETCPHSTCCVFCHYMVCVEAQHAVFHAITWKFTVFHSFSLAFGVWFHPRKQVPSNCYTQAHATQKSSSALPSCLVLSRIAAGSTCCVLMQVLTSGRLAFVTRWAFT